MKAQVGDRIVVASNKVDGHVRVGKVVGARGTDGSPPYEVEWEDDGHRTTIFPGPDTHVEHLSS